MQRRGPASSRRAALRRMWRRVVRQASLTVPVVLVMLVLPAWAGFTAQATNPGNSVAAGTVSLTDNDSSDTLPLFTLTNVKPGDTASSCIQVTYTGSLPATVKLFGTTTGSGLDPYLNLTVTRGTISSGAFADCTNFTADATNYVGSGAGVLYTGTLQAFPDTYAASTVNDRHSTTLNEAWTTNEVHSYKLTLTVADNNAGQGLDVAQAFTWQAANTTAYSDVILSDNPASYWKLDEAAGTTVTDSAAAINGTYNNSPTLNQTSGVKDANKAVTFDGTNDNATFGDNYDFAGTAAFSAEFWVNPTAATGNNRRIISKEVGGSGGWGIFLEWTGHAPPNEVTFQRTDAANNSDWARSNLALSAGSWYHIVATYDGTNMRVYSNGVLRGSAQASSRSVFNNASALEFGDVSWGGSLYGGMLDEVAVYSYALSAQQVTEHYNAGKR